MYCKKPPVDPNRKNKEKEKQHQPPVIPAPAESKLPCAGVVDAASAIADVVNVHVDIALVTDTIVVTTQPPVTLAPVARRRSGPTLAVPILILEK